MTEKILQHYIWENRENFEDLIIEINFPQKRIINHPKDIKPSDIIYNDLIDKYYDYYDNVRLLDIIGCEVPLKKDGDSTIRADFLGIMPEKSGVTVVELKKSKQTERQAFTELLAYGGHIKNVFAPMGRTDVNYVLISPMKERIVREAMIHSFVFDNVFIFALTPEYENDDVTTLRLKPWIPSFDEVNQIVGVVFSEDNFDVYKVTWDALQGDWSPKVKGENPNEFMKKRMNQVSSYAAQLMEEKGIHGFVFTSQMYSELIDNNYLLNAIVVCGLNPYKASIKRFISPYMDDDLKAMEDIIMDYVSINDFFKGVEDEDSNHLSRLKYSWSSNLSAIAFDSVEQMTLSTKEKYIEKSWGEFTLDSYQELYQEDILCHHFDIHTTGLIRKLFVEFSKIDYAFIRNNEEEAYPTFYAAGAPEFFVDLANENYFVRAFIKRLFYSDEDK